MGALVSTPPPNEDVIIPTHLVKVNGKQKINRWKVPLGLTDKETRALKTFKRRAHLYDNDCCCGFGLDPMLGK